MVERLLDKASYSLVRTNPKLTANVKLISNGNDIYLESFSANTALSSSSFKAFKVDESSTYDQDVFRFFQGGKFPIDLAFEVFQEFSDTSVLNSYGNQYEMFYSAGSRSINSEVYTEDLGMLAPLWLDEQIPNYFVIFRLDNPAAVNNLYASSANENTPLAQTSVNFVQNVLENCTAIKTFDLTTASPLGRYIRNYRNQESFPNAPLFTTWRNDQPFLWNGISYYGGGFTSNGNFVYDDLVTKDATIVQNEYYVTQGFQRNGVILANLLNLEFLFTDEYADDYSINRYFGLYINEVEEGLFDISGTSFYKNSEKSQLPKIKSDKEVSELLNTTFELTNPNGIVLYLDPSKVTTVTGLPTPQRVSEVESIFYVKDKKGSFHTIKKGSTWGNNQIRLFDKKVDVSLFAGFKQPDTFADATVLNRKGFALSSFKVLDEVPDGAKITFYDGVEYVGEISANLSLTNGPGTSYFQFFNPTGTPQEIVKAMTSALNIGIPENKRFFTGSYNNDVLYVKSRFAGTRFNRLNFTIDWDTYPDINIQSFPETSELITNANFVGGNDVPNSLLKVNAGDQQRFTVGNYIQTKGGFASILGSAPYLDEPIFDPFGTIIGYTDIDNYVIITLNDDQVQVTRNGQVALYSDYRSSFGRFSFFPVKDFDFDFYSTQYSQLGELNYEIEYYNQSVLGTNPPIYTGISSNPDIRSFFTNGGFSNLVGLIRESNIDQSSNLLVTSEYQRLEENYLKEQAIASRVIPYINKWSYYNDGRDVRNNPYRFDLSESFGRYNFAPSKWTVGQNPEGFTHEWFYLCEFPKYFTQEAIESSWSYIDVAPFDSIEENRFTNTTYTPGTFQDVTTNNFDKYFIIDKFETDGITLIDRQLRYGRFLGGDSENYSETFLRGVRVIAKSKSKFDQFINFNANKISYIKNGDFNDYRFSVILIPNNPLKPEQQIKFVKNEKWKTITMMLFVTIENDCITLGKQAIDRTSLYSLESNFVTNQDCSPVLSTGSSYQYANGIMQGSISFTASSYDLTTGLYIIQGFPDINGIPTDFINDIQIGFDGNYTPIEFEISGDTYKIDGISRVLTPNILLASTILKNGIPYSLPNPFPSFTQLRTATYNTIGGGYTEFSYRMSYVGFASLFNSINQGDPNIVYETILESGERALNNDGSFAQTFSIELRAQDDILKSVYLGVLPDPNKPTAFNLTDVIGYNLSLQRVPRVTPIARHSGYYEPISYDLFKFRDPYLNIDFNGNITGSFTGSTGGGFIPDQEYKERVLALTRYANTQFYSQDNTFGQIKDLFYHKVNQEDSSTILELSNDSAYQSLYPLINEVGILSRDFYVFSSNWEPGYFVKSIDKTAISDVIGTRSMLEKKSFFGSKYLKVPQQITLQTFTPSTFQRAAIAQPSLIGGNFMVNETSSTLEFYLFIQKRLIEILFGPVKETFQKYINPLYSFGSEQTIDDDVTEYITQNVLQLYKIQNVELYVRNTRQPIGNIYTTAELSDSDKLAAGLNPTGSFSSKILNTNPFDLKLIYNKNAGFSESFGFSITIVKK
jgi:hypothetical protein